MILVDSREPPSLKTLLKETCKELSIQCEEEKNRPFGDYVIISPTGVVAGIERKTTSDLLHTLSGNRMQRQLEGLKSSHTIPILLLEGMFQHTLTKAGSFVRAGGKITKWKSASIRNFLMSIQESGVRWQHTQCHQESITWIIEYYKYLSTVASDSIIRPVRLKQPADNRPPILVLRCIGCGTGVAERLIDKFASIRGIIDADDKALLQTVGVGPKVIENIRKHLG